jgi:hypothetical protein
MGIEHAGCGRNDLRSRVPDDGWSGLDRSRVYPASFGAEYQFDDLGNLTGSIWQLL